MADVFVNSVCSKRVTMDDSFTLKVAGFFDNNTASVEFNDDQKQAFADLTGNFVAEAIAPTTMATRARKAVSWINSKGDGFVQSGHLHPDNKWLVETMLSDVNEAAKNQARPYKRGLLQQQQQQGGR